MKAGLTVNRLPQLARALPDTLRAVVLPLVTEAARAALIRAIPASADPDHDLAQSLYTQTPGESTYAAAAGRAPDVYLVGERPERNARDTGLVASAMDVTRYLADLSAREDASSQSFDPDAPAAWVSAAGRGLVPRVPRGAVERAWDRRARR